MYQRKSFLRLFGHTISATDLFQTVFLKNVDDLHLVEFKMIAFSEFVYAIDTHKAARDMGNLLHESSKGAYKRMSYSASTFIRHESSQNFRNNSSR